jgi:hypothetical protein
MRDMKRWGTPLLAIAALAIPATAAEAKPKVKVLGWTTQAGASAPQVRNKETIDQCLDMGTGQRTLNAIVTGKKIDKGTKVGIGIWGGPVNAGFSEEPSDATVKKSAFKWPVDSTEAYSTSYGFSFAAGPFGPINIDGEWHAKVLVKGKQVAKGSVTVACG